ncbi:MAG: YkgJ family cysteine cluster protein [Candidatus Omnitrophica bacterium]|nr:YkgJ family cysteine cluster protein [Candidatus Omnitrophota bacterium]
MRRKIIIRKIQEDFNCLRCQRCCRTPGFVFLTGKDMSRLSTFFRITREEFTERYCRKQDGQWALNVQPNEACIFLDTGGCSVHEAKPQQCRDFPMKWRDEECFEYCAGIRRIVIDQQKTCSVSDKR